jgi:hypothetical protein
MKRRASAKREKVSDDSDDCILTSSEDDGDVVCYICSSGDFTRYNQIVLCDGDRCKNGVHQRCHSPILKTVPEGVWLCNHCSSCIHCVNYQSCRTSLLVGPECRDNSLQDGKWLCLHCSEKQNKFDAWCHQTFQHLDEDDAWFWSEMDNVIAGKGQ